MGITRKDGSVQSSNTATWDTSYRHFDYRIYPCMITRVYYVNDPNNLSNGSQNPQVTYEVVVTGGDHEGSVLLNVRDASVNGGGDTNYTEKILKPASDPIELSRGKPENLNDGAVVYIAFINGNYQFPIIIGRGTQPLDRDKTGATKEDGPRSRQEHNGVFQEINKNGELVIRRKGGELNATKNVYEPNNSGHESQIEFKDQKIINTVNTDSVTHELDGKIEKMTVTFKSGLKVEIDGANDKATLTTNKKTRIAIDGEADKISAITKEGAQLTIDGPGNTIIAEDKDGGRLKIANDKVGLGGSSAELLQQISDELQKIIAWTNNTGALHTHIGNLGYFTMIPNETAQYLQLGTELSTIKGLVDGIKGGI